MTAGYSEPCKIHLPSSAPDQAIFAMLLDRLPRLVT